MSDLNNSEKKKLETLFNMGGGYVLNFTDRTFGHFFSDYQVDIDAKKYNAQGTSKANRMRTFWKIDNNHTVGRIISGLIEYANDEGCFGDSNPVLIDGCRKIAQRLLSDQPVPELEALSFATDERTFEVLVGQIRDIINKNQPEAGLDRLHTFVMMFIRTISQPYDIQADRDTPLHSIFGAYVKALRSSGYIESEMTERILRSSISILDSFNGVRNNRSLAHDNPVLNYEESLLIFNHVTALIRFIMRLEAKIKAEKLALEDDVLF